MIANHIHDALAQVSKLREIVLEKRLFKGCSGKARLVPGIVPLVAATVLASAAIPTTPLAHLAGWCVVLVVGLVVNYAALACWFLFSNEAGRDPLRLKPAIDAVPALAVGAVLAVALVLNAQYNLLFGTWMSLYGLSQMAYRQSMPPGIYVVGLCYVACGTFCLLWPGISFTNPWPMGIVFCLGEFAGGCILMKSARDVE